MFYDTFKSGSKKGQPKLLRDRIMRYLTEGLHYQVISSDVNYKGKTKSFKLQIPGEKEYFIYVGKVNSVRIGKNKSTSWDCFQTIIQGMINWESHL
jgi:hypothetical protein